MRRLLKVVGVVTLSIMLGIGGVSSFASSNTTDTVKQGNKETIKVVKMMKIGRENMLKTVTSNIKSDNTHHINKLSLKDRVRE